MTLREFFSRGFGYLRRRWDGLRRTLRLYTGDERAVLSFRDTHPGETCLIIGNGPSLRVEDLERAREAGWTCFASNKIYKLYDQTDWRPDYYACTDPLVFAQNADAILETVDCPIFLRRESKALAQLRARARGKSVDGVRFITCTWRHSGRTSFYPQAANVLSAATVTFTMIELAWMMGFRRIVLIGCDHNYASFQGVAPGVRFSVTETVKGDYFSGDCVRPGELISAGDLTLSEEGFRLARAYIESHGGEILNATRGGRLEVFRRADPDELFGGGEAR